MNKKKLLLFAIMVACLTVLFSITVFAAGESIIFKVQTNDGIRQEKVDIDNFYVVNTSNNSRTITGIKQNIGAKYTADQVVEVSIPAGIKKVEITDEYPNLKVVNIDSFCIAEIKIPGFTGLTTINVASGESTVKFLEGCVTNAPLEDINIKSTKAQMVFEKNAFKDITSLKSLTFGAGDNKFTFKGGCFSNTGIESLELIDGATFEFDGEGAFAGCTKLAYVYLGESIVRVDRGTFNDCASLGMVYAANVDTISDNSFKITSGKDKCTLKLYVHTTRSVVLGQSAFDGRKSEGVVVCVLATGTTVLKNCKYVLNVGIQHEYSLVSGENACKTVYETDCMCGKVYNAYYKKYATGASGAEDIKIESKRNEGGEHNFSVSSNISYENGFDRDGVVVMSCAICGDKEGSERVVGPVVTFLGYSVAEFGNGKCIMTGVRYDNKAISYYEAVTGSDIDFGMVVASEVSLNGNNPLKDDGNAYSDKVTVIDMNANGEYEAIFKISGLKDAMVDSKFVMSAYVIVGKEIIYFQGEGAMKSPLGVAYSQFSE